MRLSPARFAWTAVVVFGVLATSLYFLTRQQERKYLPPGGDFELQGAAGPAKLSQLRGRPVVIYFGFTGCPDVCPNSLSKLSQVHKELAPAQRDEIATVLVSVDYRSDTPTKVDQYVKFFVPNAIGLTGTREQLDGVVRQYGTSYLFEERKDTAMGYTLTHGMSFYLIDRQGKLATVVPGEAPRDELKREILKLL